jgi:hypothetical protein
MAIKRTKKTARKTARKRARLNRPVDKVDWSDYGLRWDPDELRRRRRIDRNALDDELEQQAELYGEAAEAAAVAKSIVEGLEEEIKNHESETDKYIREQAAANDERITENEIKALVAGDEDRQKLVKRLLTAKDAQRRLEALSSSLKQRSYLLRDMVDLYLNGYFNEASAKGSEHARKDYKVERNLDKYRERKKSRTGSRRENLPRKRSRV